MSRSRMLLLAALVLGLAVLLVLGVWAFFIFQSRTGTNVAIVNTTATAEAAQLTLSPQAGTPSLSATIPPADTSAAGSTTPSVPNATATSVAAATTALSAAPTTTSPPSA